MANDSPMYRCYLLRLWQTTQSGTSRATLLNVHDPADQHHFLNIDDLYLFLHRYQTLAPTEDHTSGNQISAK